MGRAGSGRPLLGRAGPAWPDDQPYMIDKSCRFHYRSWPELVRMDGQVASPIIKAQNPYVTDVPVVKERSIVLLNFRCDRVRVWVKILSPGHS
ncbi:hypothetical protein EJ110_NYTH19793 [Nymphaea thermarum]|nr:hypothetical protein EJ110_NYTH19793 [Nymphaea thermarum]